MMDNKVHESLMDNEVQAQIRQAQANDMDIVASITMSSLKYDGIPEELISILQSIVQSRNFFRFFVYEINGQIAGSISIWGHEIVTLAVSKQFQNKGIGKKLVKFVAEHIQLQKISQSVIVQSMKHYNAKNFYLSLGFREIEDFSPECYLFELDLSSN